MFSVTQVKLSDFIKEERRLIELNPLRKSRMTVAEALAVYEGKLHNNTRLKLGAKVYRQKTIEALFKAWPELKGREIKSITESECLS